MSLNWEWNDKMGECTYANGAQCNIYGGNALAIAVAEYEDNTYQLAWFASDEAHMKNMLGLTKGYDNCFKGFGICKIRLDVNHPKSAKLAQLIAKSKTTLTLELYAGGENNAN